MWDAMFSLLQTLEKVLRELPSKLACQHEGGMLGSAREDMCILHLAVSDQTRPCSAAELCVLSVLPSAQKHCWVAPQRCDGQRTGGANKDGAGHRAGQAVLHRQSCPRDGLPGPSDLALSYRWEPGATMVCRALKVLPVTHCHLYFSCWPPATSHQRILLFCTMPGGL